MILLDIKIIHHVYQFFTLTPTVQKSMQDPDKHLESSFFFQKILYKKSCS